LGLDSFGLPSIDDPQFHKHISTMNINLLHELRYVASEVGYREAKKMPVEVRRWWIGEMQKEAQQRHEREELGGKKTMDIK
jgi:hypothetical protein